MVSAKLRNGMQLMVLGFWERLARSDACAKDNPDSPSGKRGKPLSEAALIKSFVVSHKGKSLNQRLYLFPHIRKYRSIFCITTLLSMHLRTPVIIVVGLWLSQPSHHGTIGALTPQYRCPVKGAPVTEVESWAKSDSEYAVFASPLNLLLGLKEFLCPSQYIININI